MLKVWWAADCRAVRRRDSCHGNDEWHVSSLIGREHRQSDESLLWCAWEMMNNVRSVHYMQHTKKHWLHPYNVIVVLSLRHLYGVSDVCKNTSNLIFSHIQSLHMQYTMVIKIQNNLIEHYCNRWRWVKWKLLTFLHCLLQRGVTKMYDSSRENVLSKLSVALDMFLNPIRCSLLTSSVSYL